MSTPRITLWTNSFKMPLRFSIGTFNNGIKKQVNDIQKSSLQIIEITPGALYILSCVAGRRIAEPARWILFDSLRDILNGKLRTMHPEKQDLLAATFGELIGVVLFALQLGGANIEIIRLLESQQGKMPDFLLVESTASGENIHVLECKGKVEDVNNINARVSGRPGRKRKADFDLCYEQQDLRADAKKQIDSMDIVNIKAGNRTVIRQKIPFGLAQQASTKNVLVSSVSDGRILWLSDPAVLFATRNECKGRNISCNICMKNTTNPLPDDSSLANVMSVLYRGKIVKGSPIGRSLSDFLLRYRRVVRAAWSGHDRFFGRSLNDFIEHFFTIEIEGIRATAIFMSITLIETAIFDELVHFNFEEGEQTLLVQASNLSDVLQDALRQTLDKFRSVRRFSQKQVEIVDEGPQRKAQETISNETANADQKWYDLDPGLDKIVQFAQEKREGGLLIQRTFPERDDTIYGSVYYEDPLTLVIHLASATRELFALKEYVEALIARFREKEYRKLNWREEYFRNDAQKRFHVGESWDMYPYPNSRSGFPGITAWLAEDGNAEVIVRILE